MVKEVKNKIKLAQSGNKQQILMEAQREFGEPTKSGAHNVAEFGAGSDVELNHGDDSHFGKTAPAGNVGVEDRHGSLMQKRQQQ